METDEIEKRAKLAGIFQSIFTNANRTTTLDNQIAKPNSFPILELL